MDEIDKESEVPTTSETPKNQEDLDDDVDLNEIDRLEEILSKAGNQIQMLEFERQMFLDCVYNDALVICAK
jgi:hypothetical protein